MVGIRIFIVQNSEQINILKIHEAFFPNYCMSSTTPGVSGVGSSGFQVQAMGVPAGFAVPPVQNQPIVNKGTIWMPVPPPLPNCPPGLEYLTQVPAPFLLPQRTGIHLRSSLPP